MEILPTVNTNSEEVAKEQIGKLKSVVEWAHLDVGDGVFNDVQTVKPNVITESGINWEIHLMVEEPVIWIERCLESGAERIIGQIENMSDQNEFVETVMRADVEVGLGLDLGTDFDAIDEKVLPWLNKVLLMGVKSGASGQVFDEAIVEKVKSIMQVRKIRGYPFAIEVDGGVSVEVAMELKELGVESVAMHTALWEGEFEDNWQKVISLAD